MTALERVLDALAVRNGAQPRRAGAEWVALCPAHDDTNPSLYLREGNSGNVIMTCRSRGCPNEEIVAAIDLTMADLFDQPRKAGSRAEVVATYDYTDEHGELLFQVVRYRPKRFQQRRPDGRGGWEWKLGDVRRVLYRLPQVVEAVKNGATIYVVEGERDVAAVEAVGAVATCNPGGASGTGKWRPEYGDMLQGADVIVIADRDDAGRAHARAVAADLDGKAASVRIVEAAVDRPRADVSDHLAAGHSLDELVDLEVEIDDDVVEDQVDERLAFEVDRLRLRRDARRLLDAEEAARLEIPPFDAGLLGDILDRPAEPPQRIDGLLPSDGRLLVVAQRKLGKTIFGLNLTQSLIDGQHFLGRFPTRAVAGNVAILNYEVTGRQLAWWAQQVGIPRDRLLLVNLRGRRNPLDHPDDRERLGQLLRDHQVEALLVDPFGRAYTGKSQNDAGEVTVWLCDLDRFVTDAGITELVMSVHAGWDGERTRGSSALEDWADAVATLVRDPDDENIRYLHAFGRDVEVDEDRLVFEPDTRTLTLAGVGSRKRSKAERAIEEAMPDVLDYVADHPGCSGEEIRSGIPRNDTVVDRARRLLVERRELLEGKREGRGGGKCYQVAEDSPDPEPRPTPANPVRAGVQQPRLPRSIGTGVERAEVPDEPRPATPTPVDDPWGHTFDPGTEGEAAQR